MADRRAQFVTTYLPYAQEAARLTGVDPAVVLAVAAHETGWGRKAPGNNFFGIKGRGQTFATHEYVNGKRVNVRAGFRSYADPRDSFLDWARLMQKPNYAGVLAATTPEDQIKALKAAGYATDPLYVRKLNNVRQQVSDLGGAIQVLPEAIAGLQDAVGGTQTPNLPVGTEAYAPALLAALDATPAQAAIDDAFGQPGDLTADQIDELTRTDAAGNYTNPLVASPAPEAARRPGPGGALGVDLGQQPAGMPPPPSRPSTFDWLGGGAPEAAMVPPPGISPLRPAFGGPGDRRPQPPTPPSRPMGMPPSGPQSPVGAVSPQAGPLDLVPFSPPPAAPAGAPAASPGDDRVAAIQSIIDQGITDPNEIWGNLNMDRDGNLVGDITTAEIQAVLSKGQRSAPNAQAAIADEFGPGTPFSQIGLPPVAPPLERANRIAGGQGGPVIPISPDEMRRSLANAGANTERSLGLGGLGTPETAMSLQRTFPPLATAPSPWSDRSRAFDIPPPMTRMAEFGPSPRPNITPDFDFAAGPGPTFTPPSLTPDIRGRPEYPGSMPVVPSPLANAADDPYRAPSSFDASRPISGGGGSDVLAAGNASPLPLPPSPFRYDPLSSARLNLPPSVPAVPSLDDIPGVTVAADPNSITLPTDIRPPAQVDAEQAPTIDPVGAAANMPVVQPPPQQKIAATATAPPTKTATEEKKRNSFLSRLLPGGGNGFLGNFLGSFGTPPTFTAYGPTSPGWNNGRMNTGMGGTIRTSGKTPSGTPWSTGTSNALGGSNALRWTGSNGQTITAYTDPNTGQTFHSFS